MNVGSIMGSNLLGRVFNLVLHAALGRLFGPLGLGGYATAVAFAGYFVFAVDFGLSPRLSREGAVAPEQLAQEYARALGLKLITGVSAFIVLALVWQVLPYEDAVRELCFLLGCSSIIRSFSYLNEAVCRASERIDLEGISSILGAGSFVGIALVFLALDYPVLAVGYAAVVANVVQLLVSTLLAGRFVRFGVRVPPHWETARAALPYAMTSLTVLAFAQIDILLISLIETQEFVGQFASVSRLLLIAGSLGALAGAALLPTMSRLFVSSSAARFRKLVNESVRGILLVAGLTMLGTFVIAKPLVVGIYGDAFAGFSPLLQAGSVYLVFKLTVSIVGMVLTAVGRQADRARAMVIGLVATVVLVLALVPSFGIGGAIGAMVGSELVLMSVLSFYLRKMLEWSVHLRTMVAVALASAVGVTLNLWITDQTGVDWSAASVALPVLAYLAIGLMAGEVIRTLRFIASLRSESSSG
ncbi:MAG: oligosaccharide flippase family protein [bacterium]|nr:oligosaccharide flippase family protein [bacterium]